MTYDNIMKDFNSSLLFPLMGIAAITSIMGGLSTMFGTSEIPKGVVRELMEGVVDGLTSYFSGVINDLEEEVKDLKEKNEKLNTENENLKSENQGFKDAIGKAATGKKK